MTVAARLKPAPVDPSLERLGELVVALERRATSDTSCPAAWPEAIALAQSIENDEGWALFAADKGTHWERLVLYLGAPQIFLRSYHLHVETWPKFCFWVWPQSLIRVVQDAKRARAKRLGRDVPPYNDAVLTDMRERRWFQWCRP
jgi:hypothetical protein